MTSKGDYYIILSFTSKMNSLQNTFSISRDVPKVDSHELFIKSEIKCKREKGNILLSYACNYNTMTVTMIKTIAMVSPLRRLSLELEHQNGTMGVASPFNITVKRTESHIFCVCKHFYDQTKRI